MKTLRTTLLLLIPFLAMTEGGAMYQRLVIVPLWINDMELMKQFHDVGSYFLYFTPPVLVIWLTMVISGRKYNGKGKSLLVINHILYFGIILSTAFYFIPFLERYVGNSEAVITSEDVQQLKTWALFSIIRQVLGFSVISIYAYLLLAINIKTMNKKFSYPPHIYPFQSKWTTVNGNHIHYIDEGKGETILFCHPPVTSSFMYREMIKELSKNYRCIALDFPGFGLSVISPESNYTQSINKQAEILDGLLKNIQLESTFLLMQECGGHAAMQVFIQQPNKLKGIVFTDTVIFPVSSYPKIKTMLSFVNSSVFNFININFNFLVRAMTRFGIRNRKLSKEERNTYKALFRTRKIRRTSTHMLYQLVVEEQLLSKIQTAFETTFNKLPALIIYGEKDPLTSMGVPQRINKLLPNSELHLIKGEGHFPHEGEPLKMSALISSWLNRQR